MKKSLDVVYHEVMDSLQFDELLLDYSVLEQHILNLETITKYTNSIISIYDNFRREHVFMSTSHASLFRYDEANNFYIHPEDIEVVMTNAIACMRHFFIGNKNAKNHKLIREYRIQINKNQEYKSIIEQMQPLEIDKLGNIWLVLSILDFSPSQPSPFKANFKIVNFKTGDFITPVDAYYDRKTILSKQEIVILQKINEGLLSKEIAESLFISVHTVNTHRQRILQKLNVQTSIEAIRYAFSLGLLD